MYKKHKIALIIISGVINCLLLFGETPSPSVILTKTEEALFPDNFILKFSLSTVSPNKTESSMVLNSRHKKGAGTMMEIVLPERSKGTRFLQKDNTLWMYNPKAKSQNAIRLSPKSSFQGSVFSNNDLGDTKYSDDYDVILLNNETISFPNGETAECYVIEGKAKSESTTYARIKIWTRTKDFVPMRFEYYTKSDLLFKRMILSDLKMLAGRIRQSKIEMESFEQPGTISTVIIQELVEANNQKDGDFSQSALTK